MLSLRRLLYATNHYHRGQNYYKKTLYKEIFWSFCNFVKITKGALYKAKSCPFSLAKRDTPVAATLQRKSSGGIIFVIITKIITKENVLRNYFAIISARMVQMLVRGRNLRLLDEAGSQAKAAPGPEKQDNRHMLHQPGRSCPTLTTAEKPAEKGAEWVPGKVPVKQPKDIRQNSRNCQSSCFSSVSAVLPAVFRLVYRDPQGRYFRLFSGCCQCLGEPRCTRKTRSL